MKIHFVRFEFGNRIRLCDKEMGKEDDTTDNLSQVTCKRCLKMMRQEDTNEN